VLHVHLPADVPLHLIGPHRLLARNRTGSGSVVCSGWKGQAREPREYRTMSTL
jgi:hypothetical protein